jgi:hypothetical protein
VNARRSLFFALFGAFAVSGVLVWAADGPRVLVGTFLCSAVIFFMGSELDGRC